jgi:starvation-inducible DNA-binding protein
VVYAGVIEAHRKAIAATEEADPVTQDMLIEQGGQLEHYQWFVRAHLEDPRGSLATSGAHTEQQAAARAGKK